MKYMNAFVFAILRVPMDIKNAVTSVYKMFIYVISFSPRRHFLLIGTLPSTTLTSANNPAEV